MLDKYNRIVAETSKIDNFDRNLINPDMIIFNRIVYDNYTLYYESYCFIYDDAYYII